MPSPTLFALKRAAEKLAAPALHTVDSYTGAPIRQGLFSAEHGNSMDEVLGAAARQFGDTEHPGASGRDLVEAMGVPRTSMSDLAPILYSQNQRGILPTKGGDYDPTLSGTLGLGADILTNPLTYVGEPIVRGAGKAVKAATPKSLAAMMMETPKTYTAEFKPVAPEPFLLERAKNKRNEFLSEVTPADLKNHKIYMTDEGVGYALSPEGDMQSVFNNSTRKGAGQEAVMHAIENGAVTGDAFDGYLPLYYNKFGWNLTKRVKWDNQYAPKGWDYAKYGTPDIVYFEYPKHLSRDARAVRARLESARASLGSGASGGPGAGKNLRISPHDGSIDWSTWRDVDHTSPRAITRPTPTNPGVVSANRKRDKE